MSLHQYITQAEHAQILPESGDRFDIELEDGTLLETYIIQSTTDSLLLAATQSMVNVLKEWARLDLYESDDPKDLVLFESVSLIPVTGLEEAEYQGHQVPLGKKMRGDTKKFKVYVRDPATGNIKKVNFGHGGKTARRLGQKTMRIRKSNPAARKSFRARHHCANPGPRTKANYWSCRNW